MATLRKIKLKSGTAHEIQYIINRKRQTKYFPPYIPFAVVQAEKKKIESEVILHKAKIREIDNPYITEKLTLAEFGGWFYEKRKNDVAESTMERYLLAIKIFARVIGNDFMLAKITNEHIDLFKNKQLKNDKTRAGINKDLVFLKHAFKYAKKYNLVTKNIAVEKFQNVVQREPDFLMPNELDKLVNNLPVGECTLAGYIMKWTGIRRTELVERCKKQHFDLKNSSLKIIGKNNTERTVPLHPELLEFLKYNKIFNSRKSNELLFTLDKRSISAGIEYAKKKVGLQHKHGRTHLIRHSLGVYLINAGFDLREVQSILGHKTLYMTTRYTKILENRLAKKFSNITYK